MNDNKKKTRLSEKIERVIFSVVIFIFFSSVTLAAQRAYTDTPNKIKPSSIDLATSEAILDSVPDSTLNLKLQNRVDVYANTNLGLLGLNPETKYLLDTYIRPIRSRSRRALALHKFLFSENHMNIRYASGATYSAQQVFDRKYGNCVGLAALFVSSARYLGLRSQFQDVEVKPTWEKTDQYYALPSHVNAIVELPSHDLHIEFLNAVYQTEVNIKRSRKISDEQAFAEYHNNIAMEYTDIRDYKSAIRHIEKSISYVDDLDHVWSNYGVVKRLSNDFDGAEKMYRKALSLNPRNLSALKNLYVLLNKTNKFYEAQKIAGKVERYSKRNPHYLARIAEADIESGRYHYALSNIKKAIRIDRKIAYFYHIKARAHLAIGDKNKAGSALLLAKSYAQKQEDIDKYAYKFASLTH